jgi:hypothetical protein
MTSRKAVTDRDLNTSANRLMKLGWGVPVEAEPYADPGGGRARFRLLVSTSGFRIELARGLLSARRWPVGALMGVPGRVVRWKGEV